MNTDCSNLESVGILPAWNLDEVFYAFPSWLAGRRPVTLKLGPFDRADPKSYSRSVPIPQENHQAIRVYERGDDVYKEII